MKLNKKTIIIISIFCLLAAGIIFTAILIHKSKTIKFAFYRVPEDQGKIIRTLVEENFKKEDKPYKFIEFNDEINLISQARKADILFTSMGLAADKAVESIPEKNKPEVLFNLSMLEGTSISVANFTMETKSSSKERISQIPLFFDGYEMLISIPSLVETKTSLLNSWNNIENFASKCKSAVSPISFAGGNSDTLLAVTGIIVESFDGKEKYNSIIKKIKSHSGSQQELFEKLISEDESFHDALKRIAGWKNKELLKKDFLKMNSKDFLDVVRQYKTGIIFMPLSEHRKLSNDIAKTLTSLPIFTNETNFYYPSMRPLNTRSAIIDSVSMISMSSKKNAKDSVNFLLKEEAQETLAFKTGLAPFLANCKIPDMQSDDFRFWIAATSTPSVSLGHAAFDNDSKKEEFAAEIRNWIEKN